MNYTNIIEKENSIILENVKDFNIKQILECGQCFRWERMTDTDYIIVAYRRVIEVIQEGSTVTILNTNMKDFNEIWKQYFDLEVNYGEIKEELSKDELLRKSVEFGYGIRILNQDPFEMLISFIISARNSIPSIMKTIKKISERWGDKIEYKGNIYLDILSWLKKSMESLLISAHSPLKCILHFKPLLLRYKIKEISAMINSLKPIFINSFMIS